MTSTNPANSTPASPTSQAPDSKLPSSLQVKAWYDARYAELGSDAMRPAEAYPIFLEGLPVETGRSLLDVSCGSGYLLAAAHARGMQTAGIDISSEAIRLARETTPESDLRVADCASLPFEDASFDAVSCLGSLEHFPDMQGSLREMVRVAKPGARFCIVVPNRGFLAWRLFGGGTEQQVLIERPMMLSQWRALFEDCGLRELRCGKDHWYLKRARWLTATAGTRSLERSLLKIAWLLLPLSLTYQFQFLLERD